MATIVMGILNVTPDSFSDGGQFIDPAAAIAHGKLLFEEGASIIDVGGESTRPGAEPVHVDEEIARTQPVVEALSKIGRVSIDTRHEDVARAAVTAGATLINDVSSSLAHVAADTDVGWVAMHMLGDPQTMQTDPQYDDVVADVHEYLMAKANEAKELGVKEIWIDPGIGFGKTVEHNVDLLGNIGIFVWDTKFPVVLGVSRKGFLGSLTAVDGVAPGPDDRLEASLAVAAIAAANRVQMLRVHDVKETIRAIRVAEAIVGER